MTIGENLSRALARAGMTQADLAARLGITAGAVGHWINDRNAPTAANIRRIADVLGVTTDELMIAVQREASAS